MSKNDAEMNKSYKHLVSEIALRMIDLNMDFSIEVSRRYVDRNGAVLTREQLHNSEHNLTKILVLKIEIPVFPPHKRSTKVSGSLVNIYNHIISPILIHMNSGNNFHARIIMNGKEMGRYGRIWEQSSHQGDKH